MAHDCTDAATTHQGKIFSLYIFILLSYVHVVIYQGIFEGLDVSSRHKTNANIEPVYK